MSQHRAVEQVATPWFSLRVTRNHTELELQPELSLLIAVLLDLLSDEEIL